MTGRLLGQNTLAGGLRTILNDVIALHGAEFGNVQLVISSSARPMGLTWRPSPTRASAG
jgi:hypothetical protein